MHHIFCFFGFLFLLSNLTAQNPPIYQIDFNKGFAAYPFEMVSPQDARMADELSVPAFSEGIKGLALDLTENVALRRPVLLEDFSKLTFDKNQSFSFQIWVKTNPGAPQGTAIMGNKSMEELTKTGWLLYAAENGAWALSLSDGKSHFQYRPTVQRQAINDGQWHQLAVSIDREKGDAWMFLDGQNVAIYNIAGLGSLEAENQRVVIGGSDDHWEYASYGQWHSFNGCIDEVKIWDRILNSEELAQSYQALLPSQMPSAPPIIDQLKVMTWNIWHGGNRYGKVAGVNRVIETMKDTGADIYFLQETYGSGERIADSLGFYFYLISSNLSIMSRYPFAETIHLFRPFNSGGAKIKLNDTQELLAFDIWLHYLPDYSKHIEEGSQTPEQLIAGEKKTRHAEIAKILPLVDSISKQHPGLPLLMGGDFNSGSHLDWIEATKPLHKNYVVQWPVSLEMEKAGFKDSYRLARPDPLAWRGISWTPRASSHSKRYGILDRIDYIYFKSENWQVLRSDIVDYHPIRFPSDHGAVVSTFYWKN